MAARLKALQPYHYKPGQSGNPQGLPRGRREQLEMIERLAREASPEMIEILQEMARHSEDDRVRTMAATKLLEFLPKVKEDSAGEGSFAAKLEKMSPRELREWLIGECEDISRIEVPEGFILSPEDSARHAVVRAALVKAVHGIAAIDGRLVDCDAFEAAPQEEDGTRGYPRHPQQPPVPLAECPPAECPLRPEPVNPPVTLRPPVTLSEPDVAQQTVTEAVSVRTLVTEPVTEPLSNAERQRRWRERQRQTE
jgi:hypothetical protein